MKIIANYKRENLRIKKSKNLLLTSEIKSYNLSQIEKIKIFSKVQKINSFHGCVKVFDKSLMKKEIVDSNLFFNYAVKVLINDCIFPSLSILHFNEPITFIISVDNRNIRIGELNNLETYLKTEFCLYNTNFIITYYDSTTNFGIQLADLTVNTFYNSYKNISLVKDVIPTLNRRKFNVSLFPKTNNINKNTYNINKIFDTFFFVC